MSIGQEQPPIDIDPRLSEYLSRRFIDIGVQLDQASKFPPRKEMPYKPQVGDMQYFNDPINHDYDPVITSEGFWGLTSGGWVQVGRDPGYGGIEQFTDSAVANINTTPVVIPANFGAVTDPKGVVQDLANNAIALDHSGVWNITFTLTLLFDGVNAGRQYGVQFYNATEDAVIVTPLISVGRNQEGSTPAASLLIDIGEANINDLFQMRLFSVADVFTNVVVNFFSFNMIRVS